MFSVSSFCHRIVLCRTAAGLYVALQVSGIQVVPVCGVQHVVVAAVEAVQIFLAFVFLWNFVVPVVRVIRVQNQNNHGSHQ